MSSAHTTYVFDAYGTLFDVHAAVRKHAGALGADGQLLSDIWRTKQLEYSWIHALMDRYRDFWQLTQDALDFAFERVPSADRSLRQALLDAYWQLDCYPEVPAVLRRLKDAGKRTAILSNGSPAMIDAAVRSAGIGSFLDAVLSVEDARTFKTKRDVYELVTSGWEIEAEEVSFQSSNRWDIAGASAFGFRTVWINRAGMPDEYRDFAPAAVLSSLEQLD